MQAVGHIARGPDNFFDRHSLVAQAAIGTGKVEGHCGHVVTCGELITTRVAQPIKQYQTYPQQGSICSHVVNRIAPAPYSGGHLKPGALDPIEDTEEILG